MKRFVSIFGLIGLVGCFLPLIAGVSFFELRHLEWMPVILMTAAFAIPMFVGFLGTPPAAALIGMLGFGYALVKFGFGGTWDLTIHADIGGKLMAIGAMGGMISAIASLADRKKA
jgi:hypothetical protein